MLTKDNLIEQLKTIGLNTGDTVMVHASCRAIGSIIGGLDQIHKAILESVEPSGTMMMYIACEREFEAVGRGDLPKEEEEFILKECPSFDYVIGRARRDHGVLAEFFRSYPGTICSTNPGARMAARGAKAKWLMENHPLNYGYGPGSPLAKLCEANGKVLLLGSDLDQVTLFHYAEHIAPIEGKTIVKYKVPLLKEGKRYWQEVEEYDTAIGIKNWPDRFFAYIVELYIKEHTITPSKIGNADSYLFDANSLVEFATRIMVEKVREL